ncbi:hypothetical protein JCM12296A_08710 [Desulfosarcina cetonica]
MQATATQLSGNSRYPLQCLLKPLGWDNFTLLAFQCRFDHVTQTFPGRMTQQAHGLFGEAVRLLPNGSAPVLSIFFYAF